MSRRTQIMQGIGRSGGTEAPSSRRSQIKKALGGSLPPMRYPDPRGSGRPHPGAPIRQPGSPAVGRAMQPRLGAQLSNRVASGRISQSQGQKTAQQRQMLAKAFGSDWRDKVFGQGGAKGISGPFATAQVRTKRSQALERAKRKLY